MVRHLFFAIVITVSVSAHAEGIDRDTLLTDAPATPDKGTVRVSAAGTGTTSGSDGSGGTAGVVGSIGWSPIESLHVDVGAFFQTGAQGGPSARVRYQFLSQWRNGIDLSGGVRFKTISLASSNCNCRNNGEVEFLVAAGRRFGKFDLVLNGVFGVETAGGGGKDIEVKGFQGYRFLENLRAGLDERLQAEVSDNENATGVKIGRDYDLTAGTAFSWLLWRDVQLQALVGISQPKGTNDTAPVGIVSASIDF